MMKLYDLHVHTNLSSCASKTNADGVDYVREAEKGGLAAIGFADHAWDENISGAWDWYKSQTFERLKTTREDVKAINPSIRVLFGAEAEYAKDNILAISEMGAELLDYVIVPHSHTHMVGYVLPDDCDTNEKHAAYLIKSLFSLCTHPKKHLYLGVAHPLFPHGNAERIDDILSHITDSDINECLAAAKENDILLELNLGVLNLCGINGIVDSEYARWIRLAASNGNHFFFGSDKHSVIPYGKSDYFYDAPKYMALLGLTDEHFSKALTKI